jgi:hypothetical protein
MTVLIGVVDVVRKKIIEMTPHELEVPVCPICGKSLGVVYKNEYWTYALDEGTGTYKGNLVDIEIRCPNCSASVRDKFPEGACNYSLKMIEK